MCCGKSQFFVGKLLIWLTCIAYFLLFAFYQLVLAERQFKFVETQKHRIKFGDVNRCESVDARFLSVHFISILLIMGIAIYVFIKTLRATVNHAAQIHSASL